MHVCLSRLLLCAVLGLSASHAASVEDRPFARAPYLQFSTPNSIYVVWRTEGPITPVVKFGEARNRLNEELSYVSEQSGTGIVVRTSLGTNGQKIPDRWKE